MRDLVDSTVQSLSDDLRKPKYRGNENPLTGHCYVASEALYHLMGGRKSGWVPHNIKHEGDQHWYLKNKETGEIIDPTAGQFKTPVPYHLGRGKGFLTAEPSKRAAQLIAKIQSVQAAKAFPSKNPISVVEPTHADSAFTDPDPWTQKKYRRGGEQEFADWEAPMPGADEHPDLYVVKKANSIVSDGDEASQDKRRKWKALNGKTSVLIGLRAHKNSPHNPAAVFLKYAIHRVENPELYTNKTPEEIAEMDSEWLKHHQQGKASTKNGHISVQDLHNTLAKNPNYIKALLKNQTGLHKALAHHAKDRIVMHNGQPHLPLVRGYGVTADKLDMDHSLASYADDPQTSSSFGGNLFHWLVPLSKIWHQYDLGPEAATSPRFGNENEYLVSPHSRIDADPDFVSQHTPRKVHSYDVKKASTDAQKSLRQLAAYEKEWLAAKAGGDNVPFPDHHGLQYGHIENIVNAAGDGLNGDAQTAAMSEKYHDLLKKFPNIVIGAGAYENLQTAETAEFVHNWAGQSTANKVIAKTHPARVTAHALNNGHQVDPELIVNMSSNPAMFQRFLDSANTTAKRSFAAMPFTSDQLNKIINNLKDNVDVDHLLGFHKNAPKQMRHDLAIRSLHGKGYSSDPLSISPEEVPELLQNYVAKPADSNIGSLIAKAVRNSHPLTPQLLDWHEAQGGSTFGPGSITDSTSAYEHARMLSKFDKKWADKTADHISASFEAGRPEAWDRYKAVLKNPNLSEEKFQTLINKAQDVDIQENVVDDVQNLPVERARALYNAFLLSPEDLVWHPDATMADYHSAKNALSTGYHYVPSILRNWADDKSNPERSTQAINEAHNILLKREGGFDSQYAISGWAKVFSPEQLRQHFRRIPATSGHEADKVALADMLAQKGKGAFSEDDAKHLKDWAVDAEKVPETINRMRYNKGLKPHLAGLYNELPEALKNHDYMSNTTTRSVATLFEDNEHHLTPELADRLTDTHIQAWEKGKAIFQTQMPHVSAPPAIWTHHVDRNLAFLHKAASPEGKAKIRAHIDSTIKTHPHLAGLVDTKAYEPAPVEAAAPTVPTGPAPGEKFRDFIAGKLGLTRPGKLVKALMKGIGTALAVGGMMTLGQLSPKLQAAFDKVNPPKAQTQDTNKWTPEGLHSHLVPIAHLESSWGKNMTHLAHSKGDFHTAYGPVGMKPSTAHEEWTKTKKLKELYPGLEDPVTFTAKFKQDWKFHNLVASSHFLRLVHRHGTPEKAAYAWRWGSTAASGAPESEIQNSPYVMRYRDLAASTGVKKSEDLQKMAIAAIRPGAVVDTPSIQANFDSGGEKTYEVRDYSHVLPKTARKNYALFVGSHRQGWKAVAKVFHKGDIERGGRVRHIGEVKAGIDRHTADIDVATVDDKHQGKGLGMAAYEALYAHVYHVHKVRSVVGDSHSTLAAKVHDKLAAKHGLDYPFRDSEKEDGRPFDRAFGAYEYDLK